MNPNEDFYLSEYGLKLNPPESLRTHPCVKNGLNGIVLAKFKGDSNLEPIAWFPRKKSWFQFFTNRDDVCEIGDESCPPVYCVEVGEVEPKNLEGWLPLPIDNY